MSDVSDQIIPSQWELAKPTGRMRRAWIHARAPESERLQQEFSIQFGNENGLFEIRKEWRDIPVEVEK